VRGREIEEEAGAAVLLVAVAGRAPWALEADVDEEFALTGRKEDVAGLLGTRTAPEDEMADF